MTTNLKANVYNQNGDKINQLDLNPKIFGLVPKESVIHQATLAQMANSRYAIAHTKLKSEVRGGGKKPWQQKGTGRARHGSTRSPLWVGGGVIFGPRNIKNFSQKINKKMKTKALFMCLSDKMQNNLLTILDNLKLEKGKTKEIVGVIKNLKDVLEIKKLRNKKIKGKENIENTKIDAKEKKENKFNIKKYKLSLLIILPKSDGLIFNAGRNLTGIKITTAESLNVLDLLKYEKIILLEECLAIIEKKHKKNLNFQDTISK